MAISLRSRLLLIISRRHRRAKVSLNVLSTISNVLPLTKESLPAANGAAHGVRTGHDTCHYARWEA